MFIETQERASEAYDTEADTNCWFDAGWSSRLVKANRSIVNYVYT